MAFPSESNIRPSQISETEIVAAQERFFVPVFGALFEAFLEGKYSDLVEQWIKPSLAEYVKSNVVQTLGMVTTSGVVARSFDGGSSGSADEVARVARAAADLADVLRGRAVEIVEQSPKRYPEYNSARNILRRTCIKSGIVI